MNDFSPHPRAGGPLPATTSDEDTVAVRTRVWCTAVMITVSAFMCLVQTSFAATRYINNPVNAMYVWFIASSLLAFAFPFLLLARDKHPEPVFWICCAVILIFPYDPMLMLMALTSLIARRRGRQRTIRAIVYEEYETSNALIFRHVRHVTAESDGSIPWTLDGEYAPGVPKIEIGIEDNGIQMMI